MKPDKGDIILLDTNVTQMNEEALIELREHIGMLFQGSALFDSLTVFENIAYPLREHLKLTEKEIQERVAEKLQVVGLSGIEEKMPSELSGRVSSCSGTPSALSRATAACARAEELRASTSLLQPEAPAFPVTTSAKPCRRRSCARGSFLWTVSSVSSCLTFMSARPRVEPPAHTGSCVLSKNYFLNPCAHTHAWEQGTRISSENKIAPISRGNACNNFLFKSQQSHA